MKDSKMTVCTAGTHGTIVVTNDPEQCEIIPPDDLALGETCGSPKAETEFYIHRLSDYYFPKHGDLMAAAVGAFGETMHRFGHTGTIYANLHDGSKSHEEDIQKWPEKKLN